MHTGGGGGGGATPGVFSKTQCSKTQKKYTP